MILGEVKFGMEESDKSTSDTESIEELHSKTVSELPDSLKTERMNIILTDIPGSSLEENLKKALTELLILHLLSQKECYISELTTLISERSHGSLTIVFPYRAIYRLIQSGCIIEIEKRIAPDGRRRQYFRITQSGINYLNHLKTIYAQFSQGVDDVLAEGERV